MLHKCNYCDYESEYRPNVRRHENNKHGVQEPTSHQQPVHHDQVVHPPNTQINPQQNALVTRNQYLQNKVIELQTLLRIQNVQTDQTFHLERDLD